MIDSPFFRLPPSALSLCFGFRLHNVILHNVIVNRHVNVPYFLAAGLHRGVYVCTEPLTLELGGAADREHALGILYAGVRAKPQLVALGA